MKSGQLIERSATNVLPLIQDQTFVSKILYTNMNIFSGNMELDEVKSADTTNGGSSSISDVSFTRLPHSAWFWPGVNDHDKSRSFDEGNTRNQIKEVVNTRKLNPLHNAANRSRPDDVKELGLPHDDSILGANATTDTTDGVDLRAKRIDMSFRYVDAASLVFSMISYFLDLVTDTAVSIFHYLNDDYWYSALTAAFILIPNLVTSCISLRWYLSDSQQVNSEPVSKFQWFLRFLFHLLQVGPILRYYESLQYGLKFRESKDNEERRKTYMKMIYEDADATMLRLFESFMESAPQLLLQMYIITKNYPFDDYEYWTATVQAMSITSSLISISWSLVSYSKSLRISLPNKVPMTYWSIGIMFLWEFFSITARMIALALFSSAFVRYVGFVYLIHWACMTIWIVSMQTHFCDTKCEELGFNAVLGVVFIFCYFNPVDSSTRYRYSIFYLVMFIENTILLFLWARHSTYQTWMKDTAVSLHYLSFFLGIALMLTYYRWFHPTGGIKVFQNDKQIGPDRVVTS